MNTLDFEDLDKYLIAQRGRVIHQVWFKNGIQSKKAAAKSYTKLKIFRDSWKIKNPTWFHIEWDSKLSDRFVKTFFPEHYDMYKNYPYEIQRCDAVRYFFLYRYGGIYADMDYYCNKPFDDALSKFHHNFYLVKSSNENIGKCYVSNSLMYSHPKHVFWKRLFIEMETHKICPIYYSRHLIIMYTTGPGILTRVYNRYKIKDRLKALPANLFNPHGISDNVLSLRNDNVYSMHVGKGSWEKNDSKILIYLYREGKIVLFIICVLILPLIIYYLTNKWKKTDNNQ